jgi:hypothetical protein
MFGANYFGEPYYAQSYAGSLAQIYFQSVTGQLSFVGLVTKKEQRQLLATLTFIGTFNKKVTPKTYTANLTFVGSIAKTLSRAFSGSLSFIGAFVTGKAYVRTLTASLSFVGALHGSSAKR